MYIKIHSVDLSWYINMMKNIDFFFDVHMLRVRTTHVCKNSQKYLRETRNHESFDWKSTDVA